MYSFSIILVLIYFKYNRNRLTKQTCVIENIWDSSVKTLQCPKWSKSAYARYIFKYFKYNIHLDGGKSLNYSLLTSESFLVKHKHNSKSYKFIVYTFISASYISTLIVHALVCIWHEYLYSGKPAIIHSVKICAAQQ